MSRPRTLRISLPTYLRCIDAETQFLNGGHNREARKELLEIIANRPDLIFPRKLLSEIALEEKQPAEAAAQFARIAAMLGDGKAPAQLPPARTFSRADDNLGVFEHLNGKLAEAAPTRRPCGSSRTTPTPS